MSLVDVGQRVGLGKATAYRLLTTLAQDDLVVQDPESKRYSLGPRLIALGQRALESTSVLDVATAPMQTLTELHPIVVYLNMPTREAVLSARRLPRSGRGEFVSPGVTMPYHACASGLVFLAHDEALTERVVSGGLPKVASGTIDEADELRRALEDVRERGFARDVDSLQEGVESVAAPIFDQRDDVVATIGATGPAGALDRAGWTALANDTIATADRVSHALGGAGSSRSR